MNHVRIGVLGAARIVPGALTGPARVVSEAEVSAIAARDPARARAFAARHAIPRVRESYDALLADPQIDAVYVPLPNGLHCAWTIKALDAGKHVLCEKPFAANAREAERMAAAAERTGLVLMEAFHYRYHPLTARMLEVIASGELGTIRHIEAALCFPLLNRRDIRYNYDLAGGALMDAGCYAVHCLRTLAAEEPEVTHTSARLASPQVDRRMEAEFTFPGGFTGRIVCSLFSSSVLRLEARVRGDLGEMRVFNFMAPQRYHRLTIRTAQGRRVIQSSRVPTYVYQLRAFAGAVLRGEPILTPPSDSIATMRVIDAIYEQAGLPPRGSMTV